MAIDKFLIGLSVGIGESISEAEVALFKAKARKKARKYSEEEILSTINNPPYSIEVYKGESIPAKKEKINPAVETYLKLLRSLEKKSPEDIPLLDELVKKDFKTTALTPLGYRIEKYQRDIELEKMRKPRKKSRYVLLFDGDNMKFHNEREGSSYEKVSKRLNAIGKALVDSCRTKENGYSDFVAQVAPLVNRKHGDAGDEFIVDLYTPKKYIVEIAERLIKAAYKAQREIKG